jgi:hypothetical protein
MAPKENFSSEARQEIGALQRGHRLYIPKRLSPMSPDLGRHFNDNDLNG